MTTLILGLLAAAFYGAGDFCGGFATKRTSVFSVTVLGQASGLVFLAISLLVVPSGVLGFHGSATRGDYLWGIAAGLCGGLGITLLYHALSIGKMGIVSPITAVLAAALPVLLSVTLLHEHLTALQGWGILIALVSVVLISFSHEENGKIEFATQGVREALLAGIVLSGFLIFLGFTHRQAGLQPLLAARATSIIVLLALGLLTRSSIRPQDRTLGLIAFSGMLDMAANALYVLAMQTGLLSIAVVLTSLYPASTVILARIVLHERLQRIQQVGVGLALIGVALIGV